MKLYFLVIVRNDYHNETLNGTRCGFSQYCKYYYKGCMRNIKNYVLKYTVVFWVRYVGLRTSGINITIWQIF